MLVEVNVAFLWNLFAPHNMATGKMLVAVAGGTSPTLGTSIVNALAQSKTCSPVIISRLKKDEKQPQSRTTPSGVSVPICYVDYDDDATLLEALKDVHTVICVIKILGAKWAETQIKLLDAARRAGVKRFAPSEFELGALSAGMIDVIAPIKKPVWEACKKSGLEVTKFHCGGFYQATMSDAFKNTKFDERTRKRIEEALLGLEDDDVMWSLQRDSVHELITDDGKPARLTLTSIPDIGRFVAAACELPDGSWKDDMDMVGQTLSMAEVNDMIEEISGLELKREKIDRKELEKRISSVEGVGQTREEIMRKLWSQIELISIEDKEGYGILKPIVNEMCPQVKPIKMRDFLEGVFKTK